ncbi:MAG TPA: cytochrome c maturation protein CcmE [Gaiellaceae bacterium]|nr:cytochrome c maturation protein CcmE [Gaiellaceae bacterium]
MRRSPARLVIALSVAAALAVFVLYTSIAGAGTPQVMPSELGKHAGQVMLVGTVLRSAGDSHSRPGMRILLKDPKGVAHTRVTAVYHGTVPDPYRVGREIVLTGKVENGVFRAQDGSMSTKCPSKYAPAKKQQT